MFELPFGCVRSENVAVSEVEARWGAFSSVLSSLFPAQSLFVSHSLHTREKCGSISVTRSTFGAAPSESVREGERKKC